MSILSECHILLTCLVYCINPCTEVVTVFRVDHAKEYIAQSCVNDILLKCEIVVGIVLDLVIGHTG